MDIYYTMVHLEKTSVSHQFDVLRICKMYDKILKNWCYSPLENSVNRTELWQKL